METCERFSEEGRSLTEMLSMLAIFESMCPGVEAIHNNVEGACPALQGIGGSWVWSGLGSGSANAFVVNLTSGAVFGTEARFRDYRFAFCE